MTMALPVERPLVQAGFGVPERQNRWTVAFRFILAVPHLLVVAVTGIAFVVVVILGWFAALVMGRLPAGFAGFISGYIQYTTRVYAYFWMLLDHYPPFEITPATTPYPVNLDIGQGPVRRLAVLFRFILLIPMAVVQQLVSGGLAAAGIVVWLVALVAGRMPMPLFEAIAAVLRFGARYYAYATMVTSKYPGELFGDQPLPGYGKGYWAPAPGAPLPPPVPPYPAPGTAPAPPPLYPPPGPPVFPGPAPAPPPLYPPPGPPTFPGPAPAPPLSPPGAWPAPYPGAPRTGRLVLSPAAKRILVVFLVLGGLVQGVNYGAQTRNQNNNQQLAAPAGRAVR